MVEEKQMWKSDLSKWATTTKYIVKGEKDGEERHYKCFLCLLCDFFQKTLSMIHQDSR